jgi:hypothetical protein
MQLLNINSNNNYFSMQLLNINSNNNYFSMQLLKQTIQTVIKNIIHYR